MIEILEYPEGQKTPYLLFDGNKGILKIEGKCIPEYAPVFFKELHPLIDKYAENPQKILDVTINLSYFNSSTARELIIIFKKFKNFPTKITWFYEEKDEDMLDSGEDFQDILRPIPFTFKIIKR